MAETMKSPAVRLSRLTSGRMRATRLERKTISPWMKLIDVLGRGRSEDERDGVVTAV
jgi:hypothetical protein